MPLWPALTVLFGPLYAVVGPQRSGKSTGFCGRVHFAVVVCVKFSKLGQPPAEIAFIGCTGSGRA